VRRDNKTGQRRRKETEKDWGNNKKERKGGEIRE
jgi:hypothetical protein